jgi:peptidoglycan/LPS O-acetylase OafA/YrhL
MRRGPSGPRLIALEPTRPLIQLPRVPALDGVRGVAVAAVLVYHGGFRWLPGGFLGVSTFFTLSGFLITGLLLAERARTGRIALGPFWRRRVRRLAPALVLTLLGVALFGATVATPAQVANLRGDGLATLGYVANWRYIVTEQSYGALFAAPSPLLHTWSLAIEEQFYVLFPLVMAALRRHFAAAIAVMAALSVAALVAGHAAGAATDTLYYGTHTRIFELLLGVLLACWYVGSLKGTKAYPPPSLPRTLLGVVGIGVSAAMWATAHETSGWLYGWGLPAYALASVAVVAACVGSGPFAAALAWRPLRALGRISYGVYLFHWPIGLWLTPERTGLDLLPLFALRLAVILPLAALSYLFLELPIRRGQWLTGRRFVVAAPAAVAVAAFAILAASTDRPDVGLAPAAAGSPVTTAPPGVPHVLVAGDSVALTVARGAEAAAPGLGIAVVNNGALGCGLAEGTGRVRLADGRIEDEFDECPSWPERWRADVEAARPTVSLLLVGAWDAADHERPDGGWVHPCVPDFDREYEARVRHAIRVLGAGGTPVVVATAPYLRSPVVTDDRAEGDRRIDCMNGVFRRAAAGEHAPVVDLAAFVCPTTASCRTTLDDAVLRPDGVHYDGPGGAAVAKWLVPEALRLANTAAKPPASTATVRR